MQKKKRGEKKKEAKLLWRWDMLVAEGAAYLLLDSGGRVVQIHQHYVLNEPPTRHPPLWWIGEEVNKYGILHHIDAI